MFLKIRITHLYAPFFSKLIFKFLISNHKFPPSVLSEWYSSDPVSLTLKPLPNKMVLFFCLSYVLLWTSSSFSLSHHNVSVSSNYCQNFNFFFLLIELLLSSCCFYRSSLQHSKERENWKKWGKWQKKMKRDK